ncbi:MAG: tRNA(Ile)(2)-agmatinylcytidine synthase [Methanomicrobiales archaeon]|nr:tRNA(Ile)(2)-agmatinylcytidine synthase [Methanomicrobiales archaeon]
MRIGIDDTDSPRTMCTTYLGAVLARRLNESGIRVNRAYLVRLNPNVTFKTRGNAAIALDAEGDPKISFRLACRCIEELADFGAENTHPGIVVTEEKIPTAFFQRAVQDYCTREEATDLLDDAGALYRGYKNGRGLIGATAATAAEFVDTTYEWLSYRSMDRWGSERYVDAASLRASELATSPHTWDTVDFQNRVVVCVPHTPDPVLFGIRGSNPFWVAKARGFVRSEFPVCEQIYQTNQGTDSHLMKGTIGALIEGRSYDLFGTVAARPETLVGGHVRVTIVEEYGTVSCMAFEPTKGFRDIVRSLLPGDRVRVTGSYKRGSINLEKLCIEALVEDTTLHPPLCPECVRRMTSAGRAKGYKCRHCGSRASSPMTTVAPRTVQIGWYEVPSCARRHLAMPLIRAGLRIPDGGPGEPL